ncbi:MAG: (d)CMP kinase [Pseudoclavibacter sp.]|nr:(d)CMP kinase [Pseudoclavibacter sp.]
MSGSEREPASGRVVVVVDGPSGSGKSSVGRAVAARLGYGFLSTGAAYRALAWLAACRGTPLDDEAAIQALLPEFLGGYRIALDPAERWVRLGGTELGEAVDDTRVSAVVSRVARVPAVRAALSDSFRATLFDAADGRDGMIAEGRDLTTIVAPDATVRILLTADESVRIARRAAQKTGEDAAGVAASVSERDRADARHTDFLNAAEGVALVDSTHLDFEATVAAVLERIAAATGPKEAS